MTGRPSRRQMGPSGRTVTLCGLGLLCGLTMLVAVARAMAPASSNAAALARHAFPAVNALHETSVALAEEQVAYAGASEASGAERAKALVEALAAEEAADAQWDLYLQHRPPRADAKPFEQAYEAAHGRGKELETKLVASDPSDPEAASILAAASAELGNEQAAVTKLDSGIYDVVLRDAVAAVRRGMDNTRAALVVSNMALIVIFAAAGYVLMRGARRDQRQMTREQEALRAAAEQSAFDAMLQRGLDMQRDEESALGIAARALSLAAGDITTELLLADSSRAHFRQALATGIGGGGCNAGSPSECPTASNSQTCTFVDTTRLDACSFLAGRDKPEWAVCVPVSIAGETCGVIHAGAPLGQPAPVRFVSDLELIARKAGERIGALRVLARTESQAQLDPLSGLPNRRTLEARSRDLLAQEPPYVVAFADLDHFKAINDQHGHDTGDRALRLFARVLREGVRPVDLVARHGGEEFVAIFPDCSLTDARVVAERIRTNLAAAVGQATVPPFTVTIGLAAGHPGDALADVIAEADLAMLRGKNAGRNRVLAATDAVEAA